VCLAVANLLGGDAGRARTVEVDVLPLAVAAVPHTGLLGLHGAGHAAGIQVLGQSNIGNTRCIFPNEVHMWIQEDGVHWLVPFGQSWKGDKTADYRETMSQSNTSSLFGTSS